MSCTGVNWPLLSVPMWHVPWCFFGTHLRAGRGKSWDRWLLASGLIKAQRVVVDVSPAS